MKKVLIVLFMLFPVIAFADEKCSVIKKDTSTTLNREISCDKNNKISFENIKCLNWFNAYITPHYDESGRKLSSKKHLKENGFRDEAEEMKKRINSSKSYDEALSIMCEYIDPIEVGAENEL